MKTVYIPKGHTVCYESLETEHLVVEGCLKTTCGVKAKTITGGGVLSAGTTSADVICLDELETGSVFCRRLLARRVQTPELFASDSAAVSFHRRHLTKRKGSLRRCGGIRVSGKQTPLRSICFHVSSNAGTVASLSADTW